MHRVLAAVAMVAISGAAPLGAPRGWTMVVAPDVTVVGLQSAKTLSGLALQIQQFRGAVGSLIHDADTPPMPTIVYAFDDRAALEPYLPLYHGHPSSLAGYCHCGSPTNPNIITASLASFADSSAILFHEDTHVLLRNAASPMPLWLNEGSPSSTARSRSSTVEGAWRSGVRSFSPRPDSAAEGILPLANILRAEATSPLYNEGSRRSTFSAEAWRSRTTS